jgi:hypothetical protein
MRNESCDGPASGLAGPISKSRGGPVGRRDIDVNDRAGAFGSSVARGSTDVALQPVLGILPKRRTGFGGCHCAGFASGGADLARGNSGDRIQFYVEWRNERGWRLLTTTSYFLILHV